MAFAVFASLDAELLASMDLLDSLLGMYMGNQHLFIKKEGERGSKSNFDRPLRGSPTPNVFRRFAYAALHPSCSGFILRIARFSALVGCNCRETS